MLDEILELDAYVSEPESLCPRLQPKLLTDDFSSVPKLRGLNQILTLIARDFLFSSYAETVFFNDGLISDEGIMAAKILLNRWCGFDIKKDTEDKQKAVSFASETVDRWFEIHPEADHFLKRFWQFHFCEHMERNKKEYTGYNETEKNKRADLAWKECESGYYLRYNSASAYGAESITYENVIADALNTGRLRTRYCAIKMPEGKRPVRDISELYDQIFECVKGTNKNIKLRMLKNIIAFRLWQQDHPGGQKEVLLQKLRLFGWYGRDDTDGKREAWYSDRIRWDGRPVMYCTGDGSDFVKFGIDGIYLDRFGFTLIDEDEIDGYRDDHWILKDRGHGKDNLLEIINN